ncbi:MAG: TonB-dependent receptor [Bryobacteraceae bacterium]|nr:TonB-dependent receptor [Bryobacteraceae bacterium]MDW8376853.1 carboxypeptidase regulatory-like domain-containing protein [Bryobacterales bacterium]
MHKSRVAFSLVFFCWTILFSCGNLAWAQSTLGVVLGTVRDATGATVSGAVVKLTNTGENTSFVTTTDSAGDYAFRAVKAGTYMVSISLAGFKTFTASGLSLAARETLRVDATLQVGELSQAVEVKGVSAAIATDTPVIQSTLTPESVLSLPANVRGGGSTSPYALIATLPGVQPDNGGAYSIQGGLPAQSESSVDGISITQVTGNSPNRNLFPSVESISEIKVQGVGNTAEYGAPGDITTISKSGTNFYHGAAFWYHQNKAFDSRAFNQVRLPSKIGNTFGLTLGGPVLLPKLYTGRNKTFFYFTWESFRFPRQATVINSVPTVAMKNGNFTAEGVTVRDPFTNVPFPGNTIPQSRFVDAARKIIPFYPDPNFGTGERAVGGNFVENRAANIESDQWDIRLDHQFSQSHTIFGRYSWKNGSQISPNNLRLPSDTGFNNYRQAVVNYRWVLRPTLLNEFLGGISYAPAGAQFPFDGRAFMNSLNFQDIQRDIFFNALPNFTIDRLQSFAKSRPGRSVSWNTQFIDNLSWTRGSHTFKFGFDIRRLRAETNLGFTTGDNYGDYIFRGTFTGAPWADFLLGVPAETSVAVVQLDNDGRAVHYKGYAQDSWRVNDRFTLEFGVRYEFHPGYTDAGFNIANFDRNIPRTGRVIIPSNPKARQFVAPAVLVSVNACPGAPIGGIGCTPFVTAAEAGIPESLRENYYTQFLPRFGFAYRWNRKTTLRGSYGLYNMVLLGSIFFSLTGTVQSDVRSFNNVGPDGRPIFVLPQTRPPNATGVRAGSVGTFEFRTANQINFHPPQMQQWSLTLDREIFSNTGLRLSYIGNKSTHLPWAPDLNQAQPSTTFFSQRPLTDRPFPNWGLIYSRDAGANALYNSFQAELTRRFDKGLTFNAAYTLAKNLADNAGPAPTSFAGETGGGRVTNSLNRRGDRGDVYATRRHRFLNTLVYDFPFGRGRKFLSNSNRVVDLLFGGWSLSSILILQSGPFLTPTMSIGDPSGTNAPRRGTQRPDRAGAPTGEVSNPDRNRWVDRTAFMAPGRAPGSPDQFNFNVGVRPGQDLPPIGRFGNAGVGIIQGPGTFTWNAGLRKSFVLAESIRLQLEGSWTNLPNWTNLGDPNMNVADDVNFGRIFGIRGSDFGGNRTGQVSLRLMF